MRELLIDKPGVYDLTGHTFSHLVIAASDVTVIGATVRDSDEEAIWVGAAQRVVIQDCVVKGFNTAGIALRGSREVTIRGCRISATRQQGICIWGEAYEPEDLVGCRIEGNVLTGGYVAIGSDSESGFKNAVIRGNIVTRFRDNGMDDDIQVPGADRWAEGF